MKVKRTLLIGIVVSALAGGLGAQVAQRTGTYSVNAVGYISSKHGPQLFTIKSGGEVVAELRLLKPARLDINGADVHQNGGVLRTATGGSIEIAPDGLSPWRITGAGLEVETSEPKPDKK